ncbi:MAG: hypothetical protein WEB07_00285 [Natronospirillum sp.]
MSNGQSAALWFGILGCFPLTAVGERNIGWETFSANVAERTALTAGAEYLDGRNIEARDYDGVTLNAPVVQLNVRLGDRGEAQMGYTLWRTLRSDAVDTANGGDPWFFTKINVVSQGDYTPATAFIWGVLEPAANPPVGADNLAFYALFAFSQEWANWRVDLNVGTGIYESDRHNRQDDVTLLNSALWYRYNPLTQLGIEFNYAEEVTSRWFDFTETVESEYRRRRIALTGRYGTGYQGFATVSAGLAEQSEAWGLALGFRYRFGH